MAGMSLRFVALATALAMLPVAGFAQEAARGAAESRADGARGDGMRGGRGPVIRLDFGAGREIAVQCGDTAIAACVEAITPLAEKLAATPAVEHGKGPGHEKAHGKGKDRRDKDKRDKDRRDEGRDKDKREKGDRPAKHEKPGREAPPADAARPGAPAGEDAPLPAPAE